MNWTKTAIRRMTTEATWAEERRKLLASLEEGSFLLHPRGYEMCRGSDASGGEGSCEANLAILFPWWVGEEANAGQRQLRRLS